MNKELNKKYQNLKKIIKRLDSAIVAFSGGVDSSLVLKVACDILNENAVAVTADTPSIPRRELEETKKIAKQVGAKHIIINTLETTNKNYLENPNNRCYYCKSELYSRLRDISLKLNIKNVLNGTNFDDIKDYRPGMKAAEEFRVISPLKDAEFTKKEVRELARFLRLSIWNKPSAPCLSSRVPYGQQITLKKLSMIEKAENFLKDFGIRELRVRHFGKAARVEVNENDKSIINDNFNKIESKFNEIGFDEIRISNFKSGSLNLMINVRAEN